MKAKVTHACLMVLITLLLASCATQHEYDSPVSLSGGKAANVVAPAASIEDFVGRWKIACVQAIGHTPAHDGLGRSGVHYKVDGVFNIYKHKPHGPWAAEHLSFSTVQGNARVHNAFNNLELRLSGGTGEPEEADCDMTKRKRARKMSFSGRSLANVPVARGDVFFPNTLSGEKDVGHEVEILPVKSRINGGPTKEGMAIEIFLKPICDDPKCTTDNHGGKAHAYPH